jgi:endogenous inhibitor of DNA gyrase (YacG/DUF329 family)
MVEFGAQVKCEECGVAVCVSGHRPTEKHEAALRVKECKKAQTDKIKAQKAQRATQVTCPECAVQVCAGALAAHRRSKKHQAALRKANPPMQSTLTTTPLTTTNFTIEFSVHV